MQNIRKGFSLIELVIVIAITMIMTAIVVSNMTSKARNKSYLETEGHKVAAMLAARKNSALTGAGFAEPCTFGAMVEDGGYAAIGCGAVNYVTQHGVTSIEKKVLHFTAPLGNLFDDTSGVAAPIENTGSLTVTLQKDSMEYEIKISGSGKVDELGSVELP